MRLCFLDFDGVLNTYEYLAAAEAIAANHSPYREVLELDVEKVRLLTQLIDRTGARIVVTSSWRKGRTLHDLRKILRSRGLPKRCRVIGTTPKFPGPRGDQIRWYLENEHLYKRLESYVILDDDSNMTSVAHRLVKTTLKEGLTQAHVEVAVGMLETPLDVESALPLRHEKPRDASRGPKALGPVLSCPVLSSK